MKGCSSCGGAKKPTMPSGKNAANPFKKSASVKMSTPAGFGAAKVRTNFKIGKS